jgi:hypothetical protein
MHKISLPVSETPSRSIVRVFSLTPRECVGTLTPRECVGTLTPRECVGTLTPRECVGALTPRECVGTLTPRECVGTLTPRECVRTLSLSHFQSQCHAFSDASQFQLWEATHTRLPFMVNASANGIVAKFLRHRNWKRLADSLYVTEIE